jgi:hypothetical protein
MKSRVCILIPGVLAFGTIFSGAAASEIGMVTEPACNGEVIIVCGEGLDAKATKIKAFCLGTADGSFRSESLEDGARHAAAIDRQPAVPEVPPAGSMDCDVVGGGPGYLQVVMRCSRQPWISVPAVTALWAGDGNEWSRPYVVNRPQAQWLSPASQAPGEVFRIFGRTFSWTYQLPAARVYLRRQGGSELVALRPAAPHHEDGHTQRWCLSAWLPNDLVPGQCQVFVHGGHGGEYGWSEPLTLSITTAYGDKTPISRRLAAIEGPMLGICCKSVISALLTVFIIAPNSSRSCSVTTPSPAIPKSSTTPGLRRSSGGDWLGVVFPQLLRLREVLL